jgi:hypothetical protein
MNKIDFGQTIGVLANLGVIAGIVFLGFELRQNSEQLAAQSRFSYYQARTQFSKSFAENGELSTIVAKALNGDSLSDAEAGRIQTWFSAILIQWEYEYGESRRGLISLDEYNVQAKRGVFHGRLNKLLSPVWETYKTSAPGDFVRHMQEEVVGN